MPRFYRTNLLGRTALYDTDTAPIVAVWTATTRAGHCPLMEVLHRKHQGEFFLHTTTKESDSTIQPLTLSDARKWAIKRFGRTKGRQIFGKAFSSKINIHFRGETARRIEILSSALLLSRSRLLKDMIDKLWEEQGLDLAD